MSSIILDSNAYKHNLSYTATRAGSYNKLICVFKGNAYGYGICLLASVARACGVNFVAVKNENEVCLLEKYFDNILILSHRSTRNENLNFICTLGEPSSFAKFKKNTRTHPKIDTNMHRNGIDINGLEKFLKELCHLNLEGASTHFTLVDELDTSYFTQKYNFQGAKKATKNFTQNTLTFHSSNSSALFRGEMPQDEMCRMGLVQFGYGDKRSKKVLRLYAHKLSSRVPEKGQSAGYGGAYAANEPLQIATYNLDYADGPFRYDGKGQLKLANGKKMLGKMSTDSLPCEDSGGEICAPGDANLWADFFHTMNYEISVKLNANIRRVLV